MELKEYFSLIKIKQTTIISIMAIFMIAVAAICLVQPLKYSATSRLLIMQNYNYSSDLSAANSSNEYLSNLLVDVVGSRSFYDEVMASGFNIDQSHFGDTPKDQIKEWDKTIDAKSIKDIGVIEVNVYHQDKRQLDQISQAVNYVLKTKHGLYHGNSDLISIKIIDQPVFSTFPAKPNILLNLVLGFILGLTFSLSYIYFFQEAKYNFNLYQTLKSLVSFKARTKKDAVRNNSSFTEISNIVAQRQEAMIRAQQQPIAPRPVQNVQPQQQHNHQHNQVHNHQPQQQNYRPENIVRPEPKVEPKTESNHANNPYSEIVNKGNINNLF